MCTPERFRELVNLGIAEGLNLEFKRSDDLKKREISKILKEICGFLNSDGGEIFFGIMDKESHASGIDGGVEHNFDYISWIDNISKGIKPNPSGVHSRNVDFDGRRYIYVSVQKSSLAPHQADTGVYFRRTGRQTIPMEHYEIEDIRLRRTTKVDPVDVTMFSHNHLAHLRIQNRANVDISNVRIKITSNVPFERDAIEYFDENPVSKLNKGDRILLLIDSWYNLTKTGGNPYIDVHVEFALDETTRAANERFYLNHFAHQPILSSRSDAYLDSASKSLADISAALGSIRTGMERIGRAFDVSGLSLSHERIRNIAEGGAKLELFGTDYSDYMKLCGMKFQDAIKLDHIFGVIGGEHDWEARYDVLPNDLKQQFENYFELPPRKSLGNSD